MDGCARPAVVIQQLRLNYGLAKSKVKILNDLNLCVDAGTIYGVLGPSSCGKTSLLRCIVGRLYPTNGTVEVFGHTVGSIKCNVPGSRVGYMPQELSLYQQLTISEILNYFGRLHRMSKRDVNKRISYLIGFLGLPPGSRLIEQLSGGQKRRVSLAIALLHEPPLLILDEPTVGVDPILRESIWNHLIEICHEGRVTVVITTHYIEEAHQAHKIGFMRNGRILIEDSPVVLLNHYNLPTLENVYHKVCEEDDLKEDKIKINNSNTILSITNRSYSQLNEPVTAVMKQPKHRNFFVPLSAGRISGLIIKNFTQIRRNPMLILLQFIIPIVQITAVFLAIGSNPHDIPIAVYNEDHYMGVQYLHHINNEVVKQLPVDSYEEGMDLVVNGKAYALIHIWKNFSEALIIRFSAPGNVSQDVLRASTVHLKEDTTDQQIKVYLDVMLMRAFASFSEEQLGDVSQYPQLIRFLLKDGDPIYSHINQNYIGRDFVGSGLVIGIPYITAVAMTVLPLIVDKKQGLYERSVVSGVTSLEVLCSYFLTQVGFVTIQASVIIMFAHKVFKLHITVICDEEAVAIMLSILVFFPGMLWTTLGMSSFLQKISLGLPHTLAVESLRWIALRGRAIVMRFKQF
uniref:ABC transporter domain-containing protein n=1 Tax=Strigamia maritima TaxID=126957 RepID=T1J7J3_STRMM